MTSSIRSESPGDEPGIRRVNDLAFSGPGESRLVDALRDGGYARISLVAEAESQIVGHILFSDLTIIGKDAIGDDTTIAALALAPTAVLPGRQRQGIGSELIRQGLAACRQAGHRIVIVLGHPSYYPRFGFSPQLASPLEAPYAGEAFMALELEPGAMKNVTGRVEYAPPFNDYRRSLDARMPAF